VLTTSACYTIDSGNKATEELDMTRTSPFWHKVSNGVTTRKRGEITGILKAKDVFAFTETFHSDKGEERVFVVIRNPSKPYVRAYD
jgi:hypothetical protein